jgi:antitoxin HicB
MVNAVGRRVAMLKYPVRIIPGENGLVIVTFPDVPEAVSAGFTKDEAIDQALPVLETVLNARVRLGEPVPRPSDICGAPLITTHRFSRPD